MARTGFGVSGHPGDSRSAWSLVSITLSVLHTGQGSLLDVSVAVLLKPWGGLFDTGNFNERPQWEVIFFLEEPKRTTNIFDNKYSHYTLLNLIQCERQIFWLGLPQVPNLS